MSRYYIAADGGGSKLQAILYNEELQIIRRAYATGVNTLFKPTDAVRENIENMIDTLLYGVDVSDADMVADLCIVGARDIVKEVLSRYVSEENMHFHSEPTVALAAALRTDGAVALSGTGSDAFLVRDGKIISAVGGWGPLLGDEGSGYDIGLNTIKAAIYSFDGRGPETVLYDLVMEEWGLTQLWDIVSRLAHNPDARHEIASAAILCAQAAMAGDRVALEIYENAAENLALQVKTAIESNSDDFDGHIVIMGGAWKGCPYMLEKFCEYIYNIYPNAIVEKPIFEAVVGCVVLRCMRDGLCGDIYTHIKEGFKDYLYNKG